MMTYNFPPPCIPPRDHYRMRLTPKSVFTSFPFPVSRLVMMLIVFSFFLSGVPGSYLRWPICKSGIYHFSLFFLQTDVLGFFSGRVWDTYFAPHPPPVSIPPCGSLWFLLFLLAPSPRGWAFSFFDMGCLLFVYAMIPLFFPCSLFFCAHGGIFIVVVDGGFPWMSPVH